jgi:SAM-dependent methyltransferase
MASSFIERSVGRTIFGRDAVGYNAGRLPYPPALFDVLVERCGLCPNMRVFEIGPGSGQATKILLEHGAAVTAIEPDPELALLLLDISQNAPECLDIRIEAFETADLSARSFDLGVAATSFGWLDPQVALAKVVELLKPGGWWAMWWNVFRDITSDPIFDAMAVGVSRPRAYSGTEHYSLAFEHRLTELEAVGLIDAEYLPITRSLTLTPLALRALYATFSVLRALPEEDMNRKLDAAEAMAADEAIDGVIERTFVTPLYLARRASS